jgi:prepilin signal peptidase PulO-like enzyme (type II secretory pathway)
VTVALSLLAALAGAVIAWALTVPLHRYKELRPMTPRDVASEVPVDGSEGPYIRASYREARCGTCHHVCSWRDVAPVVSWFRGCPECGTKLPGTVPLLQVGVPAAMVLTVAMIGSWAAVPYLFLVVVLAAISIVDLRIWLIPYWMPWAGAAVGLALISVVSIALGRPERILVAVIGGALTFVVFFVLFIAAPGKLGFGDVRLALVLGLFLAWMSPILPIYGLLFGAVLGLLMGLVAVIARGDSRFPFGPALALGAMAAVWLHQPILHGFG